MKRFLVFVLLALLTFDATQAQYPVRPAEPNEECMKAWNDYQKADRLWKTGWGLFGAGTGMVVGGLLGWTQSNYQWTNTHGSTWTHPGFIIMCVGGGTLLASIPCLAVGQTHRKTAINKYDILHCSPETCADIQVRYEKADKLWKVGWGLFGAGLGVGVIGGIMYPLAALGNNTSPTGNPAAHATAITGLTFLCVGSGMIIASIPCLAVGQVRRKAARKAYNENCVPAQPVVRFYLQSSSNGLGLAMQF